MTNNIIEIIVDSYSRKLNKAQISKDKYLKDIAKTEFSSSYARYLSETLITIELYSRFLNTIKLENITEVQKLLNLVEYELDLAIARIGGERGYDAANNNYKIELLGNIKSDLKIELKNK